MAGVSVVGGHLSLVLHMPCQTNPHPKPNDWSFTLRSGQCFSDSDDESDSEPQTLPAHPSSDDALLKDIDISSRPDNAQFKSNPWSIAKVNAASRPKPARPVAHASVKPSGRSKQRGRTIMEAFSRQAKKSVAPPSVAQNTPMQERSVITEYVLCFILDAIHD